MSDQYRPEPRAGQRWYDPDVDREFTLGERVDGSPDLRHVYGYNDNPETVLAERRFREGGEMVYRGTAYTNLPVIDGLPRAGAVDYLGELQRLNTALRQEAARHVEAVDRAIDRLPAAARGCDIYVPASPHVFDRYCVAQQTAKRDGVTVTKGTQLCVKCGEPWSVFARECLPDEGWHQRRERDLLTLADMQLRLPAGYAMPRPEPYSGLDDWDLLEDVR